MSPPTQQSPVETIKSRSNYLRGKIAEELQSPNKAFTDPSVQLLKHHGMYQQSDRDHRRSKKSSGTGETQRRHWLMVRAKLPGGKLSGAQFLALAGLADELGGGALRITSRQDLQIYRVSKKDIGTVLRRINAMGLTTLGACGDIGRNVACCPAPYCHDPVHGRLQALAEELSERLTPRTAAYREIWLADGTSTPSAQIQPSAASQAEPLYGASYLPRKFKVALGLPGDNCVDIYTHDLGLLAICEDFDLRGFDVLVGGGMGRSPGNKKTFAALAQPMAFVTPEQVVDIVLAVVRMFRDTGNRADRKQARLKYLLAQWGMDKIRSTVQQYYGQPLAQPHGANVWGVEDHLGWHGQGDGRVFLGLFVENGRIADVEDQHLKSALKKVCQKFTPGVRLSAQQNLLLTDIDPQNRPAIETIFRQSNVPLAGEISDVRRGSMACVALPTCPMAITESERVLPRLIDQIEEELERLGLADMRPVLRMTGCSNGCSRPYNAEIGLVGRSPGKYAIYLGGRSLGDRLGFVFQDRVPLEQIVSTLLPVFSRYKNERFEKESFADFCQRTFSPLTAY